MGILKLFRITMSLAGLALLVFVGHAYHTNQYDVLNYDPRAAKFVGSDGSLSRTGAEAPSLVDTVKVFFAGLMGKEEENVSDLAALHKRRAVEEFFAEDGGLRSVEAETAFWTGMLEKVGLGGTY